MLGTEGNFRGKSDTDRIMRCELIAVDLQPCRWQVEVQLSIACILMLLL